MMTTSSQQAQPQQQQHHHINEFGDVSLIDAAAPLVEDSRARASVFSPGAPPDYITHLSREEYEDLMQSLETSLYEDLLREEAEYLDTLEQQDVENMIEAHFGRIGLENRQGNESSSGGSSSDGGYSGQDHQQHDREAIEGGGDLLIVREEEDEVLCPLCQGAFLLQRKGVLLCPHRDLRLDGAIEGLQLRDLKRRLAAVLENHGFGGGFNGGGCSGRAVFEQTGVVGMRSLMMRCDTCGALEVVL